MFLVLDELCLIFATWSGLLIWIRAGLPEDRFPVIEYDPRMRSPIAPLVEGGSFIFILTIKWHCIWFMLHRRDKFWRRAVGDWWCCCCWAIQWGAITLSQSRQKLWFRSFGNRQFSIFCERQGKRQFCELFGLQTEQSAVFCNTLERIQKLGGFLSQPDS